MVQEQKFEVAVLAGGCFWCLEAVFDDLKGVTSVESGYTGGAVANPSYEQVCSGMTGHAEVVRVTFDPQVISFKELLQVFFTIHDPTTLNRQHNDVGSQYRSAVFVLNDEQRRAWDAYYEPRNAKFRDANLTGKDLVRWRYQRYLHDYLGCVKAVDEAVGRLLQYLDDEGLAKNTVVVFSSDQGFYLGEHGWFDKRFMYEESLRMPLVVRYPKEIPAGSVNSDIVLNLDFGETFLDFAGVPVPADMQGRSLRPLLQGRTPSDWRTSMYYHYYEYPAVHSVKRHYGVRTERYKLIHYQGRVADDDGTRTPAVKKGRAVDQWELFDLDTDPDERVNLCGQSNRRGTIDELKARLESLRRELKAGP